MVTRLLSEPNPLPGSVMSLATTRSSPFSLILSSALATVSRLSAAKPTRVKLPFVSSRMSTVGTSLTSCGAAVFFILSAAGFSGRKSATAAAIISTSAPFTAPATASFICAAVSTLSRLTPAGSGMSTVDISVTLAPRSRAASASA